MKRILITLLLLNSFSFAENETMIINDENQFFDLMFEQMKEAKEKYNLDIEVSIRVSKEGIFSYKILKESEFQKFNEDIIIFLEEKTKIKFPNLKNKNISFNVTFRAETDKEKEIYKNIKELKN